MPQQVVLTVQWGQETGQIGYEKWVDPAGEQTCGPSSFAVDANGNIFFLDSVNGRIIVYNSEGSLITQFPLQATYPLDDVLVDSQGSIWVSNYIVTDEGTVLMDVYKYSIWGELLLSIPNLPYGEIWTRGNFLYIARNYEGTSDASIIAKYDLQGNFIGNTLLSPFHCASRIVIDEAGNFYTWGKEYVGDGDLVDIVEKYSPTGELLERITFPTDSVKEFLDVDGQGNLYLLSGDTADIVQKYSAEGELLSEVEVSISDGDMTRKLLKSPSGDIYIISADPDEAPDVPITITRYEL